MKTFHLCTDPQGFSTLEALPLPFLIARRNAWVDDEGNPLEQVSDSFTQNVTFEEQGASFTSLFVRDATTWTAVRHADREVESAVGGERRYLAFVLSGLAEVTAAPDAPDMNDPFVPFQPVRNTAVLGPGDVLFVDDRGSRGHTITYRSDCCVVEVDMTDAWMPTGLVPPVIEDRQPSPDEPPVGLNLTTDGDDDDKSMVCDWKLFPDSPGATPARPIVGIAFRRGEAGLVSAWHTHATESLMLCLSGEAEVETGNGERHRQRTGSACYTNEFKGRGHISRILRDVHMADIVISDPNEFYGPHGETR